MNTPTPYKEFHDSTISIKRSFTTALIAMALSVVFYLLFSLLIYLGLLSERTIRPIVFIVTCLSTFTAGFMNSKKARQCGWANGAAAGGIYMVFYYLFSIITSGQFIFCLNMMAMILLGLLMAVIGGILGINFRANKKCRRT